MKQETYDAVLEVLSRNSSFNEGIIQLKKIYPLITEAISEKTLKSIQAQYYVRRMKRCHHNHYSRESREKYYKLYKEAKSRSQENVIAKLAAKNDISPCLLARIILEEYYWNDVDHGRDGRGSLPPGFMTNCIRDIAKLPDPELANEIYVTTVLDNFYGPAVDSIKKSCGVEYEIILRSHCLKAGLLFIDEDQMRNEGYDKTPDIRLKIPIMINKRVVNWIESKASFGDPINNQQYMIDQFLPYKNRFGNGAVIYWFGYVDELAENGESGILLLDRFPTSDEIVSLKESLQDPPVRSEECIPPTGSVGDDDEEDPYYNYVDSIFDSDAEDLMTITESNSVHNGDTREEFDCKLEGLSLQVLSISFQSYSADGKHNQSPSDGDSPEAMLEKHSFSEQKSSKEQCDACFKDELSQVDRSCVVCNIGRSLIGEQASSVCSEPNGKGKSSEGKERKECSVAAEGIERLPEQTSDMRRKNMLQDKKVKHVEKSSAGSLPSSKQKKVKTKKS